MSATAHRPTLLRWTRFASDPHGTGGKKRSAQIRALCEAAGFGVADMQPPAGFPRWRAWLAGLPVRWRWGRQASVDRAGIGLLGYRALFYREALARHRGIRMLLWETTYDSILPTLARNAGYRVVALPHNLEAFVTEAAFANPDHDVISDLALEISRLGLADTIFTIAKEERWLLEGRGLFPHYLPFYPDPVLAGECRQVRERRLARARPDGSVTGPLLILGSAFNPATVRGMKIQLEWLRGLSSPGAAVVVVGPETEKLCAQGSFPGLQLLGRVESDALRGLLESCSALLIHTVGGAGAVTRIPEALLAGIPVIANANAARDVYATTGVHIYETPPEFHGLVRTPLPVPPVPPRPAPAEFRFQEELRRLAHTTHA